MSKQNSKNPINQKGVPPARKKNHLTAFAYKTRLEQGAKQKAKTHKKRK